MVVPDVWKTKLSPQAFLERSARVFGDREAVVYGERRYSYAEMYRRVNRFASALRRAAIGKDDRVAFLTPNVPAFLEAHYAVPLSGGVLVPINIRLSPREVDFILDHSEPEIIFVDPEFTSLVEASLERRPSLKIVNVPDGEGGKGLDGPDFESFLDAGDDEPLEWSEGNEDDLISINYTSGTTGQPKGVMCSHRGAYLQSLGVALEMHLDNESRYLWTLPMFHCNGWCCTWSVTAVGGAHICLRKADPDAIWDLILQEKISHFCGAPTVLVSMLNHPKAQEVNLGGNVRVVTAGAPPSPTLLGQVESAGIEVIHQYGLTETYGPYTFCEWQAPWDELPSDDRARIRARQGIPLVTADRVRVVDDSMKDVPADGESLGEVVMRGNTAMKGYYKQPETTSEAFHGGWFHSGDLGVMHPDGYIELRDRKKDMIISGGEHIYSIELESAIVEHPGVLEVAVIAIPDDTWGEVPKAFVVPRPGANLTEEEIIEFARARVAPYKRPKTVAFGDLPKTSTGKVQKHILREREWGGHDKRIH
ncbi:MAG: long-chain-fatty-acid--CoA ligase [Deltaproteobacteria bacterium]|nr:long-chain-fatty-acid--CoA ligase [Deltaproteobacteria bacterium]